MNDATKKIIANALELPHQTRALLAEKLIESLDEEPGLELTEEWKREIDRRCREIDEDNTIMVDSEEVFKKAFETLG